jgi:hypothetical protein
LEQVIQPFANNVLIADTHPAVTITIIVNCN